MSSDKAEPRSEKKKPLIILAVIGGVLLIACAILSVFAAFLAPAFFAAREKASMARCANNLKVQRNALAVYQTNTGSYPSSSSESGFGIYAALLEKGYLDSPQACFCPGRGARPKTLNMKTCGYIMLRLRAPQSPPADFPVAWCKDPHATDKRNVVFADKRVEALDEREFQALLAKSLAEYGERAPPK